MVSPFAINGITFPPPKRYPNMTVSTTVSGARNANNKMVGQKVSRDNYKASLEWTILDAQTWSDILKELDKFYVTLRFPDMVNNTWRELTIYPGDRSADMYEMDPETGMITKYMNCKVNFIDAGW